MTIKQPFFPHYGANQVLAAAAASASVPISHQAKQLRVVNTGAAIAHFRTYNSTSGAVMGEERLLDGHDLYLVPGE